MNTPTNLFAIPSAGAFAFNRLAVNKTISTALTLLIININLLSSIAHAQTVFDVNPPVVTLDELDSGIAGETQIFTALVTDDISVQDVKLYYRFSGQVAFQFIEMQAIADSNYYSASLPTDSNETRSIEYYLQARDNGGNRVVRGFAFEPLTRTLSSSTSSPQPAPPAYPTGASPTETAQSGSGGFKWWYVLLGLIAVGAAAGLAGGDDSDPDSSSPNLVPVNVTVSTPQ